MSSELKGLLKGLAEAGMDHLVMQLALGLKSLDRVLSEARAKGFEVGPPPSLEGIDEGVVRSLAFEVFADHKCGGIHHWLVIRSLCRIEGEEATLTLRCYACKLERTLKIPAEEFRRLDRMGYNELYRYVLSLVKGP